MVGMPKPLVDIGMFAPHPPPTLKHLSCQSPDLEIQSILLWHFDRDHTTVLNMIVIKTMLQVSLLKRFALSLSNDIVELKD